SRARRPQRERRRLRPRPPHGTNDARERRHERCGGERRRDRARHQPGRPPRLFAYDVFVRDMRPQADLSVTQSDSPDPAAARGQLTYTVTVRNDGPAGATGVTLVDSLPDAAFVSATPTKGSCARDR